MPCTTPTTNVSKRKLKSGVYKYFNREEKIKHDGTKDIKAVCIACGDELAGAPTVGTTHLKRHHNHSCQKKKKKGKRILKIFNI